MNVIEDGETVNISVGEFLKKRPTPPPIFLGRAPLVSISSEDANRINLFPPYEGLSILTTDKPPIPSQTKVREIAESHKY